jgi:hypothetical protein
MEQNLDFFSGSNPSEQICIKLDESKFNLSSLMTVKSLCYGVHPLTLSRCCRTESLFRILFLRSMDYN